MRLDSLKTLAVAAMMTISSGCLTAKEMCQMQYDVRAQVRETCGRRNTDNACKERAEREWESAFNFCLMRAGITPPGCYIDQYGITDCTGYATGELSR